MVGSHKRFTLILFTGPPGVLFPACQKNFHYFFEGNNRAPRPIDMA
jgi:hypothetical protein